jgi:hypothetical protein
MSHKYVFYACNNPKQVLNNQTLPKLKIALGVLTFKGQGVRRGKKIPTVRRKLSCEGEIRSMQTYPCSYLSYSYFLSLIV